MTRSFRSATACGSSGSTGDTADAAHSPPAATAGQDAGTTDGASAPDPAANAPKVPDSALTPPSGGTFSTKQKEYLSGRVPKGTDPAAVLEGGQEICDRLTRVAKLDKDAAAGAVVTGEITDPQAAVTHLCPEQQPVLDTAARGFADGSFTVGSQRVAGKTIAPGRYRAPHLSRTCQWRISGAGGKDLGSGSGATVTVPSTARSFTSTGCYAWLPAGGTG